MTEFEISDVLTALEAVEKRENERCKRFCELNPYQESISDRELNRDIYLAAIHDAREELKKVLH